MASHTPGDHEPVDLLAHHAARLLRTGGILAVLTHTDSAHGELRDPTGDIVAAAQNADLLYLQHIVCLLAPIRDGGLTPLPADPAAVGDRSPAWFRHRRVHADLLVFAQPHNHHTPAAGDAQ
ncbi:hypothetical protein F1721_32805 [Saccharopolyspora hirsuta]|uniref:Class I SAM-dependent methyltransferase n=1 Tax=Saccharopolyspora hirsuta TaxID=1837 RepID=A0A5M7BDG2_SACHI|nr:hypothetical protein F1721_32805 [Saccharopolyspora hirsuta]